MTRIGIDLLTRSFEAACRADPFQSPCESPQLLAW